MEQQGMEFARGIPPELDADELPVAESEDSAVAAVQSLSRLAVAGQGQRSVSPLQAIVTLP
jgi:hypothetical protein